MSEEFRIEDIDVMQPKLMVSDDLKVIYINEAFEEKLQDPESEETKVYEQAKADHEGYVTRLRRMPITLEHMKRFANLKRDSYLIDLIARKEEVLKDDSQVYEIPLIDAFKGLFFARYPQCRNVFKMVRYMDEREAKNKEKGE